MFLKSLKYDTTFIPLLLLLYATDVKGLPADGQSTSSAWFPERPARVHVFQI